MIRKEITVNGKRVSVVQTGEDEYSTEISYKVNNNKGVHIATPVHVNLGNRKNTEKFIVEKTTENTD